MALLLVLLAFAAIAVCAEEKLFDQGYMGFNATDENSAVLHASGRFFPTVRLLLDIPTSSDGAVRIRNNGIGHSKIEEAKPVSLHQDNPKTHRNEFEIRHVKLVIVIPSMRPDRRQAIRETWAKWANDDVVIRFFTEPTSETDKQGTELLGKESGEYGDVIIQDIGRGMNFGLKLLWAMRWVFHNFSFDFLLRLDDDYFLCLKRLLNDLQCLLLAGERSSPIYAGYRACRQEHKASYVDESYILLSSVIIDRVLAVSDLNCSGYGSLTAGAWLRVGGPGNPEGDVAFVNDYRLDRFGVFWKKKPKGNLGHTEYGSVCERRLGIHHTYSANMYKLWTGVSSRSNASHLIDSGCESLFSYEDDGECPFVGRGVDDKYLHRDNVQPCDSFTVPRDRMYCGGQGC